MARRLTRATVPAVRALVASFVTLLMSCSAARTPDERDGGARADATVVTHDAGLGTADDGGTLAPLDALRASVVPIDLGWRFAEDRDDTGVRNGWATLAFDDHAWTTIDAGRTWEEQGHPGYDGVAWYRRTIDVPSDWHDAPVRVVTQGIDDEYDVYVNGSLAGHHGARPDRSVYSMQTEVRVDPMLRAGERNVLAIRVVDWGLGGGLWRKIVLRRDLPLAPFHPLLPEPVLDAHPEWIALYWRAWQLAWQKVAFAAPGSGLSPAYMDEGFNEQIYQWDSSFITLFGRYGLRVFPVMATLDNFYRAQREDGYIARVYSETTGGELESPTPAEPLVNPPIFAWVEWEYYRFTGDDSRLARVFPVLERYYTWLETNVRASEGAGLYYQTGLGSGMDNTPRGDVQHGGWIDMSLEQVLAAKRLGQIASVLGRDDRRAFWEEKASELSRTIVTRAWNESDGFFYDVTPSGAHVRIKHVGAFWALLSGVASPSQAERLVAHLRNPSEFWRAHVFPSLAASEPDYNPRGNYWRGGAWAPTNYMIVRGLEAAGYGTIAQDAAENHLANLAQVYASPPTNEAAFAPEERRDDYHTLWECYAPDAPSPGTRWDDTYYSRQDFVGWSGLGPIAMLLESVLGFDVVGAENRIVWSVRRTDRHGALRLPLGADATVSLVAEARTSAAAPLVVTVDAERAFTLELRVAGREPAVREVSAGHATITLP